MRHAEFACHCFACRIQIDADDLVCTDHACSLDHVQADTAETEHDDIRARFYFGREQDSADAGGDAAADVANLVEGCIFTNFRERDFWYDDVVGKSRCAHVMKNRLAIDREAAGRIRHQTATLG